MASKTAPILGLQLGTWPFRQNSWIVHWLFVHFGQQEILKLVQLGDLFTIRDLRDTYKLELVAYRYNKQQIDISDMSLAVNPVALTQRLIQILLSRLIGELSWPDFQCQGKSLRMVTIHVLEWCMMKSNRWSLASAGALPQQATESETSRTLGQMREQLDCSGLSTKLFKHHWC